MHKSAYKFGISLMASLLMLSTITAAIPMGNMNIISTAMASDKDRDDDKRYHYDNNKRYQQSTYEQDRYASSYDLSYNYDSQQLSYDQQPNYGYSSQSSYSDYNEYKTHDKKHECRTGPFEGFFVSSEEFCDAKQNKFKDNNAGPPGSQGPPGANGKDGINGTNGVNGTNGNNGTNIEPCVACLLDALVKLDSGVLVVNVTANLERGLPGSSDDVNVTLPLVIDVDVATLLQAQLGETLGVGANATIFEICTAIDAEGSLDVAAVINGLETILKPIVTAQVSQLVNQIGIAINSVTGIPINQALIDEILASIDIDAIVAQITANVEVSLGLFEACLGLTPPPPAENAKLSINKEWFACNDDGIDCTVRSESDITFETPSSGNYTSCTEQNDNCSFVADTELNIQISGNGPTPNTIPALVDTQASVNIGSGPFNVTESLSTESQSLFPQLPIPVGDAPTGIAYDPVNERMYVTNQQTCCAGPDTVSVIDTTTNTVIDTITVGGQPTGIAYDNATERMYVTNSESFGTVSVIDTTTNTVIGTPIPVGEDPDLIAYDPVNERMYVANFGSDTVSVIDTTTNMVIGTPIPVGINPTGIAYDPVNERMYVTNFSSGTVSVIDTTTNTVIGTPIPIGNNPQGIAYDPVNERMYVTNSGSDTVSVIDTTTNTVIGTITVGITVGIAYDPVNERMYVTNFSSGTVSVIDTTTNTVIGTPIPVGDFPLLLAYDPVNERMYVTNLGSDTVSVLYLSANKVCQDSGFDAGELRTYESNGQTIEQITCVNFVGDCSGDIQGGETKECTVQDYAVRVNDISNTPTILAPLNQEINQQQVQQEMEDE